MLSLFVAMLALTAFPAGAQTSKVGAQDPEKLAVAKRAIAKWLATHREDRDRIVKKTVKGVDDAGTPGLRMLAGEVAAARKASDDKRLEPLLQLVGHVGRRWLKKVEKSKLIYAGQYGDLAILMPDIGDFYFRLLVDTPNWFPLPERGKVIPALRDLFPKRPDNVVLDQVEAMAKNEDEPESLRTGLGYALAQWGNRRFIKTKIQTLEKKSRDDDAETAILASRDLAEIYYKIRDYQIASVTYREFIRKAETADYYLVPVYYYNAACCMCLSGDRRTALQYLQRCLKLNRSSKVDSSMRMVRRQFENDPEIALVRSTPEFRKMLDAAFGESDPDAKKRETGKTP